MMLLLQVMVQHLLLQDIVLQGGVKVILELSNKNCDHGSHIQEIQLRKVSRLKLCVYYT